MLLLKSAITVYLYIEHMAGKHTAYHVNKSDIGYTRD